MSHQGGLVRACLFGAVLAVSGGVAGKALASDPLAGDAIALPPDVNIGLIYNDFADAGELGAVHGSNTTKDTHISTDVTVFRYVRSFQTGPFITGVQAYIPYVGFLGTQRVGASTPLGPARATLSANSGFGQPNFGGFMWPINDANSGTYVPVGFWYSPPISSFNKNYALNPGQNSSLFEVEGGFRTTLLGTPKTQNLAFEMWGEAYFFGNNSHSASVSPTVTFNNVPGISVPSTVAPATFREQSSEELRFYLPYLVAPAVGGFISPGFYQTFGGKQTYELHNGGGVVDSGNRTNESQLRLIGAMFLSPTLQVMGIGEYDVASHGGPLYRSFTLRIAKFF